MSFGINIDLDECQPNPCLNGGTCTDDLNDYKCNCTEEWEGKNCDTSKLIDNF